MSLEQQIAGVGVESAGTVGRVSAGLEFMRTSPEDAVQDATSQVHVAARETGATQASSEAGATQEVLKGTLEADATQAVLHGTPSVRQRSTRRRGID